MSMFNRASVMMRPLQLIDRFLQWASSVIVLGITGYLISRHHNGEHIIYQIVIAALSVVFFLPAFISPFLQTKLGGMVLGIDIIFSYLWLTAFIFAAQDYNWQNCFTHAPPGIGCSRKHANEAFIFLAFIFTFFGMFLEIAALYAARGNNRDIHEKNGGAAASSGHHHDNGTTAQASA
ncbi:hypothetical protein PHISCL_02930 [Aspergillus sclerotialis]|uniref:MARVEL domain-containing protein n=1 Tax=Aspergillus sclerotialis TaxID=2070753 RepID=A0A3A3A5S8_9EURO|nr:hypothetical protein PHISCL_02930 [Aspergillus sclerotialis]